MNYRYILYAILCLQFQFASCLPNCTVLNFWTKSLFSFCKHYFLLTPNKSINKTECPNLNETSHPSTHHIPSCLSCCLWNPSRMQGPHVVHPVQAVCDLHSSSFLGCTCARINHASSIFVSKNLTGWLQVLFIPIYLLTAGRSSWQEPNVRFP